MKIVVLAALFLGFTSLRAQSYDLTFYGISCGSIVIEQPGAGEINFTTTSTGLIDRVWPFSNHYETRYDTTSYGLRYFKKTIRQSDRRESFIQVWDERKRGFIVERDTIPGQPDSRSIFTLLASVRIEDRERLDARWIAMDHEGRSYRARWLWADSTRLFALGDSLVCDHYRLDIKPDAKTGKSLAPPDYFMENIIRPEAVRQLWVERHGKKRIIKASFCESFLTLEAMVHHE